MPCVRQASKNSAKYFIDVWLYPVVPFNYLSACDALADLPPVIDMLAIA